MLVLVTVGAEQLPIAAVRRIMVVITILVMHLEQLQVGVREGAGATAANPRIKFQRLGAITGRALRIVAASFAQRLVEPFAYLCHSAKASATLRPTSSAERTENGAAHRGAHGHALDGATSTEGSL